MPDQPPQPPNPNDPTPVLHYSSESQTSEKQSPEFRHVRTGVPAQAIIACILGIAAIPLTCINPVLGVLAAWLAIFIGYAAYDTIKTNPQTRGMPLAIVGMVGGALWFLIIVAFVLLFALLRHH